MGALTNIPGVVVTGQNHDLLGQLRAGDLGDHIVRGRVGQRLGIHLEPQGDLLAGRRQTLHPLGVLNR